ncbi:MAG TPA: CBS domain-containing protein, partial [Chitinophagales bacterium]|nr:CBS domain-containing protein [Chitinophagales bacterium]
IISKSDFTRLTSGTFYATQQEADTAMMDMFTLEDIMIKNPVVISSELTIKDAADTFIAQDFHALPVVDNGQLTGILSVTDLLRHLRDTL